MAGSAMFSFRAGRKMATAFAAGFAGTYTAISTAKAAHAQAPGNERYMLAGADGPEWASHVLGKSRWNVHSACIAANDPIEDRLCVETCAEGIVAGVFDGHYGPRTAEYARQNTRAMFTEALRDEGGKLQEAMVRFYSLMEEGWAEQSRQDIKDGDWTTAMEGSCAVMAYVMDDKYVIGNLGDCRALLVKRRPDGSFSHQQLSRAHNASDLEERRRVQAEHPTEPDAVTYLPDAGTWYVRGTLQVTRALGDLFLKRLEFYQALPESVRPVVGPPPFIPPYVSHTPEVVLKQIEPDDMFLVLASDGLWDELRNEEVTDILLRLHSPMVNPLSTLKRIVSGNSSPVAVEPEVKEAPGHLVSRASLQNGRMLASYDSALEKNAGQRLLWGALMQNPVSRKYGVQYLTQIPPGRQRRSAHDDISVVVVFLNKDAALKSEGAPAAA